MRWSAQPFGGFWIDGNKKNCRSNDSGYVNPQELAANAVETFAKRVPGFLDVFF
jgi:hypothetical protein|tara:strand:- start:1127 stop:1288 length:162 start_codon:yes stop_codon:yes gene_type:complete